MNNKLTGLLTAAIITGLISGSIAKADTKKDDSAKKQTAEDEKNKCKGEKEKNSCKNDSEKKDEVKDEKKGDMKGSEKTHVKMVVAEQLIKNNMTNTFCKDLGVGVGLRSAHHSVFLKEKPKTVSWVEVISENFMPKQNGKMGSHLHTLKKIRENYPVVLHGVSLSIGSVDEVDFKYLDHLKTLIEQVQPAWVSDHLCWTGVKGQNLHDLLPLPYTAESLSLISDKLNKVQDHLGRKILIENPSSYFEFQQSEMTEWDFFNALLDKTGCGLLLDLNNIYVSAINHSFNPLTYLENLKPNSIGQIHLAGHSNLGTHLIDTHDTPVCDEVWELFRWTTKHFGKYSTMIERDGNIPEWKELELEILKIAEIRNEQH